MEVEQQSQNYQQPQPQIESVPASSDCSADEEKEATNFRKVAPQTSEDLGFSECSTTTTATTTTCLPNDSQSTVIDAIVESQPLFDSEYSENSQSQQSAIVLSRYTCRERDDEAVTNDDSLTDLSNAETVAKIPLIVSDSMIAASNPDQDDLEDGEIETDEDDAAAAVDDDDDEPVITAIILPSAATTMNPRTLKKNLSAPFGIRASSPIQMSGTAAGAAGTIVSSDETISVTPSSKKNKFRRSELEDDWAGNIEHAIAAALKKDGIEPPLPKFTEKHRPTNDDRLDDMMEEVVVRRNRKRKKREEREKNKKRVKRRDAAEIHPKIVDDDDLDEDEMLCVRSGSPQPILGSSQSLSLHLHPQHSSGASSHHRSSGVGGRSPSSSSMGFYGAAVGTGAGGDDESQDSWNSSYDSYDSAAENRKMSHDERRQMRRQKDRRNRGGRRTKRQNRNDSDGGDDCPRSHDARAPRKLELCKFYLMDCCAKKEKCSYMHGDFPCKYYYLGMDCVYKTECKFAHGKPLTEQLKNILLKHIETAPKEILGNFRRISRENATNLLLATNAKLCTEYGVENTMESPQQQSFRRHGSPENRVSGNPFAVGSGSGPPGGLHDDLSRKEMKFSGNDKARKSRWCDMIGSGSNQQSTASAAAPSGSQSNSDILNLKNLKGVITPEQIEKLAAIGIENLEQISQLTVAQLNNVGLTISQINEIQLNAMNIEKLGLISNGTTTGTTAASALAQTGEVAQKSSTALSTVPPTFTDDSQSVQDVDMRFLVGAVQASTTPHEQATITSHINQLTPVLSSSDVVTSTTINSQQQQPAKVTSNSETVDFSQYLRDSNLKDTDLLKDKDDDDALNEDEPELQIDESRCAGSDDEAESTKRNRTTSETENWETDIAMVEATKRNRTMSETENWDTDFAIVEATKRNRTTSENDWDTDLAVVESTADQRNRTTSETENWDTDLTIVESAAPAAATAVFVTKGEDDDNWDDDNIDESSSAATTHVQHHDITGFESSKEDSYSAPGGDNNSTDRWQQWNNPNDSWKSDSSHHQQPEATGGGGGSGGWRKNFNDSRKGNHRRDSWRKERDDQWNQNSQNSQFSTESSYKTNTYDSWNTDGNKYQENREGGFGGGRENQRSDPRSGYPSTPQYEDNDMFYGRGAATTAAVGQMISATTTGQYRDPRLGNVSGNLMFFNNAPKQPVAVVAADNYEDDWDADERATTTSQPQQSPIIMNTTHQDVIPPVIRESSPPTKYHRTSIYDGQPKDGDSDQDDANNRDKDDHEFSGDRDMRMSSFLDSGDIDLRLPFKPVMTNYTPATEIDASISLHAPILYKVLEIHVPRPDYSEIRRSMSVTEKTLDPRLRRIFCLKEPITDHHSFDSDTLRSPPHTSSIGLLGKPINAADSLDKLGGFIGCGPRIDPRRRKENLDAGNSLSIKSPTGCSIIGTSLGQNVDIRLLLQKSHWYKNLNSKFKIMVNQQLAVVSTELKKFHQDANPDKVFDMKFIATNQYLQQVLTNLGIFIDGNGQILQLDGEGDDQMMMTMGPGQQAGLPGTMAMMSGGGAEMMSDFRRAPQPGGVGMPSMNARFMNTAASYAGGPRFGNEIRPGLLGVAPGIVSFNPFDGSSGQFGSPSSGGYHDDEQQSSGNPFADNDGKYFGRGGGDGADRSSAGRGNRNFRQGGNRGGNNGSNDRWSGNGPGRNNLGRNRNNEGRGGGGGGGRNSADRDGRRDKLK